jgi:outer membrane protein assembly factor BamB
MSLRRLVTHVAQLTAVLAVLGTGSLQAQSNTIPHWPPKPPVPGIRSLQARSNVLTANYNNERTNANLREYVLNTSNVNSGQFGKLFSVAVDGQIYAQPLYVNGIVMPGGGTLNVVYTATMHNSVYAVDADSGSVIWQVNLGASVLTSNYFWP